MTGNNRPKELDKTVTEAIDNEKNSSENINECSCKFFEVPPLFSQTSVLKIVIL